MKFNIFELGIFSFNSYVYYLTRGFNASARAFNLLTRAFNFPTRAFSVPTRAFNLVNRAFSLLTRGFKHVTREFELITRGFELVTWNLCFTFPFQKPWWGKQRTIKISKWPMVMNLVNILSKVLWNTFYGFNRRFPKSVE